MTTIDTPEPVMTFCSDGTIKFGSHLKPDEAAKAAWEMLSGMIVSHNDKVSAAAPTLSGVAAMPEVPTDAQMHDACMSYRHDYGIMNDEARMRLQWQCREWWRCISKSAALAPFTEAKP